MDGNGVMISLLNLSKTFSDDKHTVKAIDAFSLDIRQGEIVCLLGPSGCGKTTVLRVIAGLESKSGGSVKVRGESVSSAGSDRGLVFQEFALFPWRTVRKNIEFGLEIKMMPAEERHEVSSKLIELLGLAGFENAHPGKLSGGMKQKLGLACVLVHEPRVLILDEPTNGVDPVSRQEFWDILQDMKQEGMTILISTAYLDEGEKCDYLALMHQSRIFITATPQHIQSHFPSLEQAIIDRIKEVDKELLHDTFRF